MNATRDAHVRAQGGGCVRGCPACAAAVPRALKRISAPLERAARRGPATFRPVTPDELRMVAALAHVTFPPGFYRFHLDCGETGLISDPQADALRRLVRRYRRQIPAEVVALAEEARP